MNFADIRQQLKNPRFSFWKMAGVVFGVQFIINGLTLYTNYNLPDKAIRIKFLNWQMSGEYLRQQLMSLILVSALGFLALNIFYTLTVKKAGFKSFCYAAVMGVLVIILIDQGINYFYYRDTFRQIFTAPVTYFSDIFIGVIIIAIALLITIKIARANDVTIRNKALELLNIKLELEKKEADYELLKAQINPHFLYNSLNYLYARALPVSDKLADGILTLAEIMKYSFTNQENEVNGKVLLNDEINYVEKVIAMNALRFSDHYHVEFRKTGNPDAHRIIPFVLITIVENALKYGEVGDKNQPVIFDLTISHEELHFAGINKKRKLTGPVPSTGLGISNMMERLKKIYNDRFDMKVTDTGDVYTVNLKIPLSGC